MTTLDKTNKKQPHLLKDLVTDPHNSDRYSHTKLWSNIGYLTMTIVIGWTAYKGTMTWDMFLIYAVSVTQPALLSKYLSLRFVPVLSHKSSSEQQTGKPLDTGVPS